MHVIQRHVKFVAALIGVTLTAGVGVIAPEALQWMGFVGALVTAVAVYAIPNAISE